MNEKYLHECKKIAIVNSQLLNWSKTDDQNQEMLSQLIRYHIEKVNNLLDIAIKHIPESEEI